MPIASVSARPRMYGTNIAPAASGLRPIASIARLTPNPSPIPGPMAPRPIARPAARLLSTWFVPPAFRRDPGDWFVPSGSRGPGRVWWVGVRGIGFAVIFAVATRLVFGDGDADVGHRQQGEDECLDKPEQQLEAQEHGRDEEGER